MLCEDEEDDEEEDCLLVPLVIGLGRTRGNVILPLTRDSAPSYDQKAMKKNVKMKNKLRFQVFVYLMYYVLPQSSGPKVDM